MGYVQAYLKCYYPLEFWTAALNTIDRGLEKHGQSSLGNYINTIINSGIEVVPPNINKSEMDFYGKDSKIYFALSYIKGVASGAESIVNNRPYEDWDDFLNKALELKFNKRVVKNLIFSGACDFDEDISDRPFKWLQYLSSKKKSKKATEEIEEAKKQYFKNGASIYVVISEEYDLLKYSFTGIQSAVKDTKYARVPLISDRDPYKRLWVLLGYIDNIKMKKSKKSGKSYLLLTLTDFREPLQVYVFGDYKNTVQEKFHKGQLVKCAIKNENNWPKIPWASEIGLPRDKLPIEAVM
jgi:DNA polymerase III alpha subunit